MTPPATLFTLLTGAIDFAGLFPPATLPMSDAVARYARYRIGPESWALGRFVVPLTRTDDLVTAQAELGLPAQGWRLSVLLGDEPVRDAARVRSFNAAHARSMLIDSAEVKLAGSASAIRRSLAALTENLPPSVRLFVEIPLGDDLGASIAAISAANACAKIRTGGTTNDSFPDTNAVAGFLACCAEHDTRFKATAGLHHPLCGTYPLTYEPGAPRGRMFGFLNLMVAAAMTRAGAAKGTIVEALQADKGGDFHFGDDSLRWRDVVLTRQELVESHATFALSFGSCSFEEPISDLRCLKLL